MRDWIRIAVLVGLLVVIIAASFAAGFMSNTLLARSGNASALAALGVDVEQLTGKAETEKFKVFWEAWDIVQREFYGKVPDDKGTVYGAIRGALGTLNDPNTTFLEPRAASMERSELAGQFEGIGATVQMNQKGQLVIISPMVGSPAEKANLKPGDIITKVDGREITGMDQTEAILLIRGPKGSTVTLTIQRGAESLEVPIVRAPIETPTVTWRIIEDLPTAGYIRLNLFGDRSNIEVQRAVKELRAQGAKAIVLDVRNNPGGFLNAAIDITSQFIDDGIIAYERHSDGKEETFRARAGGVATDLPVVVLVNPGSASASEILAGAIRDRKRGILVGTKTYGKGSVQNVHQLSDGSTLHVTVAHWLTPDKHDISQAGIEPHIAIEQSEDATKQGRDDQLARALEYLRTGG